MARQPFQSATYAIAEDLFGKYKPYCILLLDRKKQPCIIVHDGRGTIEHKAKFDGNSWLEVHPGTWEDIRKSPFAEKKSK